MLPGARWEGWIWNIADKWKDTLRGWVLRSIGEGVTKFTEDLEPGMIDQMRETLINLRDNTNTPQEYKDIIDKALTEGNIFNVGLGWVWTAIGFFMQLLSRGIPIGNLMMYDEETIWHSYRFTPEQVIDAWRRGYKTQEDLFDDIKHQGWSDGRIEWLKEFAKILPPVADMVRFADYSSFDPTVIAKWRKFYDAPGWITDPMSLIGITNDEPRDWANKYWFSHWRQPGRYELGDMYRRGLLGTPLVGSEEIGGPGGEGEAEETIKLAYKTMGYSSFWQDQLLQLVREIPTRVDVRRWWDMRTIDEAELESIYQRQGYFGKDLENYVLWTKVYVAFPDLIARMSKGWINPEDVSDELERLGMPPDRVKELMETKIAAAKPERTAAERDLTKTDIYKGVKQGIITRGEAIELLMDLNFDEDEAIYLLAINIPYDEEEVVVKERSLTKADIIKGLKAEIITEAEARTKLIELRYSAVDAEFLLDIFKATIKPPTEPRAREASKADIVLAVKKGLITPEEAYLMLQDISFTPEASEFILMVRVETSPFSPVSFSEFKDVTHKYRVAAGMEASGMPEELIKTSEEVVRLTKEVEALNLSIVEEKRLLVEDEVLPEAATARLTELEVTRNRAIAELSRVQSEYDRLVAEWKHGLP